MIQIIQTYVAKPGRMPDLAEALIEYENEASLAGYVGRRRRSQYTDPATSRAMFTGTLQHPQAAEDMINSDIPEVAARFAEVTGAASAGPIIEKFEAGTSRNDHYCPHTRWKEIVLICDPVQGHSSLRCNECGGVIAVYKLGLPRDLRKELYQWEAQYDRLHVMWIVATQYREWAENEISSTDSAITQMGRGLAQQLCKALGVQVYYYLHMKQEGMDRQCPTCGQRMHEAVGTVWNLSCRECSLVVGRG